MVSRKTGATRQQDEVRRGCYCGAMESIDLIARLVNAALDAKTLTLGETKAVGADALQLEQMSGGDINDAAIVFVGGTQLFAKWNQNAQPQMFEIERDGLARLKAAAPQLAIPTPYAAIDDASAGGGLLLEYFEGGKPVADFDAHLGRGLAEMHRTTDARGYGWETPGYCGATALDNTWSTEWVEFYRDRRLLPLLDHAKEKGMPTADVDALSRLLPKLDSLLAPGTQSSLIHGDLWSGNQVIAPDGRPALVDPAAFFAHRELELGMMTLFGGFSERVYAAYDEAFPLEAGWRDRLDLYELFHVLNHYHLFGGAYGMRAASIARKYL